jgi:hypothetical protein
MADLHLPLSFLNISKTGASRAISTDEQMVNFVCSP